MCVVQPEGDVIIQAFLCVAQIDTYKCFVTCAFWYLAYGQASGQ